ncbi:Do family serine endopeptidase [Rosenbergiella epipactidis]|uniref:Do family serine endopeptidase n=1 Tax=Rosenbergiella epipactidis TaxID=1544694 RepID=UPI0024E21E4F|nr:Do family serine endopeptidase [Rosenbergiella epipactidis]
MMKKNRTPLALAMALSMSLGMAYLPASYANLPAQVGDQPLPSLAPMLAKTLPSVVSVQVSGTTTESQDQQLPEPLKRFLGQAPQQQQPTPFQGLGSGVIIDAKNGYILTNNHVVNGADKITVQLGDGNEYPAKLVGHDSQTDIALIQVKNAKNLVQINVADSDALQVGDFAVAIGNPYGLGQTATSGIISALGRSGLNIEGLENFIQTDAAINRGNSGGALVNLKGELVGINTAILAASGGNIGIGFAIPSNMAMNLAHQLIKNGKITRGQLGLKGTEMSSDMAKAFHVDVQRGAFVAEVLPNSAAAKAGIKAGDIITGLNGKPITSFAELRVKVGTSAPGDKVTLTLLRDGKSINAEVTLEQGAPEVVPTTIDLPALQGAAFSDGMTLSKAKGVRVDSVTPSSPAQQIGLHTGDVITAINRQRVESLDAMSKILATKPPVIAMSVMRGKDNLFLLLR